MAKSSPFVLFQYLTAVCPYCAQTSCPGEHVRSDICILSVLLIGRATAIICKTDSKHISTIYKTFLFIICGKGNKKA